MATANAKKKNEPKNTVQVSFHIDRDLKQAVIVAAESHGRTQSEQFAQSVKDGVVLQELIKKVSDHLTEEISTSTGLTLEYKPNEDTCMWYIISAVEFVIEKEKRESTAV